MGPIAIARLVCHLRWLCLLLLLWGLVACAAPTPTSSPAAPAPEAEPPITLVFWHAWPSPEQHVLGTLVERFNQSHSDTQILLQAMPIANLTSELRTAALVGSGPHLVLLQSHTLGTLAAEGLILPLDETLFTPAERASVLATALQSAQVTLAEDEAVLYGVPLTFDTLALYYQQSQFTPLPTTMTGLLQEARALTDLNQQPPHWGLALTLSLDKTIAYLPAFGGQIMDEQGELVMVTTGQAGTERWLEWQLALRNDARILAVSDSIAVDSAIRSQAAPYDN
ncbi:MAG: hypothetical protein HC893_10350 [Chloroflexaceae bacterium]|nr:hypothetical protein [Chloroflexaceae bacterium]